MKKKVVVIFLVFSMILSFTIVGCRKDNKTNINDESKNSASSQTDNINKTGLPIVKDKVTLKMMAAKWHYQKNFADIETFRELEAKTNVSISWDLIPNESYVEKKNLLLASDDLPDAFFGTSAGGLSLDDIMKYGPQGVLIPLEKLIDDYSPNITSLFAKKPDVLRVSKSPDSHIYTLPFVQELESNTVFSRMYINKTWVKKLGFEIPTSTDELYKVLKAFKEQDPNGNKKPDEIPMSFRYKNHNYGHYGLFGAFGSLENTNHVSVQDNKVIITPTTNEYKNAILYFNKLYKEGLIDQEAFTQDGSQYSAKGSGSDMIYGLYFGWGGAEIVGNERYEENYIPFAQVKGPEGHQMWLSRSPAFWRGYFAITSKNKYPEITMRWADELYNETVSIQLQYGPLGVNLKQRDDGKIEYLPTPSDKSYGEFRLHAAPGIGPFAITAETFANKIIPNDNMEVDNAELEVYKPYIGNNYLPDVIFTAEQTAKLANLKTDIFEYMNTMQARWITGDGSIEKEWDSYISELKKMGLDDLQKVYQDAYDIYMK
ncbi:MAG TPA: extracellular solute-binding protein [Clostridiales bacterium]|nr:extracellular solute-binding protein [Clostridiales bacterium]